MNRPYIEHRTLLHSSLSKDIAQHMFTRQLPGTIVIVTDKPGILLSSVRKQWIKILRTIQRERASTLVAAKIQELNYQSMHMQRLPMSSIPPETGQTGGVFFIPASGLGQMPTAVHTVYVTLHLDDARREELAARLPRNALIVLY